MRFSLSLETESLLFFIGKKTQEKTPVHAPLCLLAGKNT
jgi:hypothetical protein